MKLWLIVLFSCVVVTQNRPVENADVNDGSDEDFAVMEIKVILAGWTSTKTTSTTTTSTSPSSPTSTASSTTAMESTNPTTHSASPSSTQLSEAATSQESWHGEKTCKDEDSGVPVGVLIGTHIGAFVFGGTICALAMHCFQKSNKKEVSEKVQQYRVLRNPGFKRRFFKKTKKEKPQTKANCDEEDSLLPRQAPPQSEVSKASVLSSSITEMTQQSSSAKSLLGGIAAVYFIAKRLKKRKKKTTIEPKTSKRLEEGKQEETSLVSQLALSARISEDSMKDPKNLRQLLPPIPPSSRSPSASTALESSSLLFTAVEKNKVKGESMNESKPCVYFQ